MKEFELLPCPYRGGEAEIKDCAIFLNDGILIKCSECHAKAKGATHEK